MPLAVAALFAMVLGAAACAGAAPAQLPRPVEASDRPIVDVLETTSDVARVESVIELAGAHQPDGRLIEPHLLQIEVAPDQRRLLVSVEGEGTAGARVVLVDIADRRVVASFGVGSDDLGSPTWLSDGRFMALWTERHAHNTFGRVVRVSLAGEIDVIASGAIANPSRVRVSPDGEHVLAWLSRALVLGTFGGEPARLIEVPASERAIAASWRPDGAAFAYLGADRAFHEQGISSDGSQRVVVPSSAGADCVRYSDDATQIAYVDSSGRLWVAPTGGGSGRALTRSAVAACPAWSRDGWLYVAARESVVRLLPRAGR